MPNIKSGFSSFTFKALLTLLNNVIDKLTVNVLLFPALPVSLLDLQNLADKFNTAISRAIKGSEAARAERDEQAVEVKKALLATAEYVRMLALGNAAVLTKSGFELMKQPVPVGQVGTPLMKAARMTGLEGQLELLWTSEPGAYSYQGFQSETDPTLPGVVWTPILATTRTRAKVNGLVPYKAYWFCVQALGADGAGAKSDPMVGRAA